MLLATPVELGYCSGHALGAALRDRSMTLGWVPFVVAGGHRVGLTESHASGKGADAARMGTEIPSKREGSRSGLVVESLSLHRGRFGRS